MQHRVRSPHPYQQWNSVSLFIANIRLYEAALKGSLEKKLTASINRFLLFESFCSVQKYIFCSTKASFLLQIDSSGIINCNTFSVLPSIFNENARGSG